MTKKKYKIIYADPSWAYNSRRTGGSMKSGSAQKYPVMDLERIGSLPIQGLINRDAACFLWVTVPLLDEGFYVLRRWGFKYKTALFWHKIGRLGMGYWFRGNVEVLLFGIRGGVKPFGFTERNIYEEKPRKHSEKPEYYRELIEETELKPRLELFASKKYKGWDSWGLDIKSDVGL